MLLARTSTLILCSSVLLAPRLDLEAQSEPPLASPDRAAATEVMIIGAVRDGGSYEPISSGSGTIVSPLGAILTNDHVLVDARSAQPYDAFFVARHYPGHQRPEILCRGTPDEGVREIGLDLAMIQCTHDLDGRPWRPYGWPAAVVGRSAEMAVGRRLWVLGFPITNQGHLAQSGGLLLGRASDPSGLRTFLTTDATISFGNSGGGAFNGAGELIGVATAFRHSGTANRPGMTASGLIVPIEVAGNLLQLARRGWQAGDPAGLSDTAPAAAVAGSRVALEIRSTLDQSPIEGAVVVLFPARTSIGHGTFSTLTEHAIAIGSSDPLGRALCSPAIAAGRSYRAVIVAPGHHPTPALEFALPNTAGPHYAPWQGIQLAPILVPQLPENN